MHITVTVRTYRCWAQAPSAESRHRARFGNRIIVSRNANCAREVVNNEQTTVCVVTLTVATWKTARLSSSTAAWHIPFTPSFIGLMFLSASSSSSEWSFIAVCRATLLSTSFTAASLRLMLPVASGSAPQVATSSSCHVIVAPSSAVGRFLLQVRQPGTRSQIISAIRRSAKTLLGDCWRHTCLRCIRACSALEALRYALYKCSTYLLTYLLTSV